MRNQPAISIRAYKGVKEGEMKNFIPLISHICTKVD